MINKYKNSEKLGKIIISILKNKDDIKKTEKENYHLEIFIDDIKYEDWIHKTYEPEPIPETIFQKIWNYIRKAF